MSRGRHDWIDFGHHPDACVTKPETCGAAGGAISFWFKNVECPYPAGILNSLTGKTTGFDFYSTGIDDFK